MITYNRLMILTAVSSAILTFFIMQTHKADLNAVKESQPQQLRSTPQPLAPDYNFKMQPKIMTLAWQPTLTTTQREATNKNSQIGI